MRRDQARAGAFVIVAAGIVVAHLVSMATACLQRLKEWGPG
jgi:hypothetical protein